MLCTSCCRAGTPDTWIPGSDRLEIAAWCCLGLPGLLVCMCRHLVRAKVCRFCGSQELIREARASRRPARIERRIARLHSAGRSPWPSPLRSPRERLRLGAPVAVSGFLATAAAIVGALQGGSALLPQALALWTACWLFVQLGLLQEAPLPCRAWDDRGHALPVEVL